MKKIQLSKQDLTKEFGEKSGYLSWRKSMRWGEKFRILGADSMIPDSWKYVNLVFGNHLVVSDEIYKDLQNSSEKYLELFY